MKISIWIWLNIERRLNQVIRCFNWTNCSLSLRVRVCLVSEKDIDSRVTHFRLSQHKRARTRVVLISAHTHTHAYDRGKKAIKHWGSVKKRKKERKRFNLSFFLCGRVSKKRGENDSGHVSLFVPIERKRTEQEEEAIVVAKQLNFLLLVRVVIQ